MTSTGPEDPASDSAARSANDSASSNSAPSDPPTHPTETRAPVATNHVPLRDPVLEIPAAVLEQHGGRILDPTSAVTFKGQKIRPTVYVGTELLVRLGAYPAVLKGLNDLVKNGRRITVDVVLPDERILGFARSAGLIELAESVLTARIVLGQEAGAPSPPPDAWTVLQELRQNLGRDTVEASSVSLNHLLCAGDDTSIEGAPKTIGQGVDGLPKTIGQGTSPSDAYAVIGYGGRQPVNWVGAKPTRHKDATVQVRAGRRPVVAVLDTGAGRHPWLPKEIVDRQPTVGGQRIGLADPAPSPEASGVTVDPLEGTLDPDAGHGTFIAGLIRQTCPDANILAVRVMYGDGVVQEQDLLDALSWLLLRHADAQQNVVKARSEGDEAAEAAALTQLIDVISLSLGYYHEEPPDLAYDQLLLLPLEQLATRGVVVAAAAGNDATSRPMYPAAFAPYPGGRIQAEEDTVPLISVGATNPNRKSTALFSNDGAWVVCKRPGAALISTLPRTFNASLQPTARVIGPDGEVRETIDPDDFRGGFAIWSGTSFSAPVLAGEVAQQLLKGGALGEVDDKQFVDRAWTAISALTKLRKP